jgi:PmbA protein
MKDLHNTVAVALDALGGLGAQMYSARASASKTNEFNVDGGKFSLFRTTIDASLALTAIKDQKRGVVSGNSFEEQAVRLAAADCLAAAEAGQADPAWDIAGEGRGDFKDGAYEPDMDKLFARSQEMLSQIGKEYPKIMLEQVIISHTRVDSLYENSKGVKYTGQSGCYDVSLMFSGHEGDKGSSFNGAALRLDNLDKPFLDQGGLRQTLKDAENQIHTVPVTGKFEGAVVFTPECLGSMLGELMDSYVGSTVIMDGTSRWKDSLESQVADPRITIRMAPRDPRVICGERYTAEGYLSEDYALIEKGVLKHFMLSDYAARKTGHKRAPNSTYQGIMEPGEMPLSEIIASIPRGLLVGRYSGGSTATSGEFSGVAKNTFLIEDGKVTDAVSETMIAGNLAGMLNRVIGISSETVENGHGSLPWLAVDGITISGN